MNSSRLVGIVAITLLAGACSSSNRPRRYPAAYPPPLRWAPPAPGYQTPPMHPRAASPPVAPPPRTPFSMLRLPAPPPLLGVFRPVNVRALMGTIQRSPCAPAEMSPGNWIGFDCSPLSFITRSVPFFKPRSFAGAGLVAAADSRENGMEGPMKNQGAVGTCTAVSLSTVMEHELRRMGVQDPVSALHVWSQYAVPRMGTAGGCGVDAFAPQASTADCGVDAAMPQASMAARGVDSSVPQVGIGPKRRWRRGCGGASRWRREARKATK